MSADAALEDLHLRLDCLMDIEESTWSQLKLKLGQTKRNYFRNGLALDGNFQRLFLEAELNANAMLIGGSDIDCAQLNVGNFNRYARSKYGAAFVLDASDQNPVWLFNTVGVYLGSDNEAPFLLHRDGPFVGNRIIPPLDVHSTTQFVLRGADFLSRQVKQDGRFVYGLFPCFDREVAGYNALRHASSTYAMLEAWEVTRSQVLMDSIERALDYLIRNLIHVVSLPDLPAGNEMAFLVDIGNEVKLGGNAVCVLALCKYTELTGDRQHMQLLERLAHGMAAMFNTNTGQFVHVLSFPDLTVKEVFRIIYYDGEAAFALMRLYRLTRNPAYLQLVERAFEYFIQAKHDRSHDHWLSYCVNEMTMYKPLRKYFEFGIRNFQDYLDFVLERITTFPTLLELMMAAEQMLQRMKDLPEFHDLLGQVDLEKFYRALNTRANLLIAGYFWPELAMFFANPKRIEGSFFIRHQAFRVRIDDVEHYLSGLIAYRKFLLERKPVEMLAPTEGGARPLLVFGGDVNLGRRMHLRVHELRPDLILDVPVLRNADLALVNLECVVAISGEQGVDKGEGGPYYFRAKPEMLDVLKQSNISAVITANNHCGDYGQAALVEQAYWLEKAGLKFAGSGRSACEAGLPFYTMVGDVRVAVFGIDTTQASFGATGQKPGSNFVDLNQFAAFEGALQAAFRQARAWADLVLLGIHWGLNLQTRPSALVRKTARRLIDLGVDAILGSSAHVLQGVEVYRGCPIVYDAGDLLFDSRQDRKPKPGAVFGLRLTQAGVNAVEVYPVQVGYGQTTAIHGEPAIKQLNLFAELCRELGTFVSVGSNAVATLRLDPLARKAGVLQRPSPSNEAMAFMRLPAAPPDFAAIRQKWLPAEVPQEVAIEPVVLGPLVLKGVRIGPRRLTSRTMIWVETFWEIVEPLDNDLLLDIEVVPVKGSVLSSFGVGCDHQPCDWLEPTAAWIPGQTYRDWYGLRPPKQVNLRSGKYCLSVRVLKGSEPIAGVTFLDPVVIEIQGYSRQYRVVPLEPRPTGGVWTAQELEQVTGGVWVVPPTNRSWVANGVVRAQSHARFVGTPCLFVASNRENLSFHEMNSKTGQQAPLEWDRHDQLPDLQDRFCGAIVKQVPVGLRADFPLLKVDDPIRALMELGAAARHRMRGVVVAITGSAGKSSVVSMAGHVASAFLNTVASYDNYNSRVGMLICLASMAAETQLAVLEVAVTAINAPGYVPIKTVSPDVAVITNIAASHLKPGETLNDVARRKANIMVGVRQGGVVILNRDDSFYEYFLEKANKIGLQTLCVGRHEGSDVRLIQYIAEERAFQVSVLGRLFNLQLDVPGEHMALNACFAMAILNHQGVLQGLSDAELRSRFLEFRVPEGRGNQLHIVVGLRKITVINEAYNANPSSMKAALLTFAQSPVLPENKLLVLGDMLEQGDLSADSHLGLLDALSAVPVRELLLIGMAMHAVHLELMTRGLRSRWFESSLALTQYLLENLRDGDLAMLKASNGVGLLKVIEMLQNPVSALKNA